MACRSSSSWTGVAPEDGGDDDKGRGAVELRGALGPGSLLQRGKGPRPDHAEAPGRGQMVIGSPPRQLEQRLELPAIKRLRPERLVGAASANRRLDIHLPTSRSDDRRRARCRGQGRQCRDRPRSGPAASAPGGGLVASNFGSGGDSGSAPSVVVGVTGIGGPGVAAGGVSGGEPPEPDPDPEPLPPEGGSSASGIVGAPGVVGMIGVDEPFSGLVGAGFGARGGTGEIGNAMPATAGSTWAVTQTGV